MNHPREADGPVGIASVVPLTRSARGLIMTIRLMLADDHRMLREGLGRSMREQGFDVVGEASDGAEAVAKIGRAHV